jgi:PKD domain
MTLAPAPAPAAPSWLPATDLSVAGRNAEGPAVAVDPQGDAAATWYRSNGKNLVVQSSLRPAGSGAWQAPVNLSEEGVASYLPQIAFDSAGDVTAIWAAGSEEELIQSSVRLAGSAAWGEPVTLIAGGVSRAPRLAVDEAGGAVAIWERSKGEESAIDASVRPTASGAWQKPTKLGEGNEPAIAIDQQGDAVAAWTAFVEGTFVVMGSYRPAASGVWGEPIVLSAKVKGQDPNAPSVAIDDHGNAVAVWYWFNGTINVVQSVFRPAASGIWQEPVRVSAAGAEAVEPTLAMNPGGDAVATWTRVSGGGTELIVQAAVRPAASAAWQEPVSISAKGQSAARSSVAIDPQGDAVAVWERNQVIQGAVRPAASGSWQEPVNLSAEGEEGLDPKTAIDPQGNAVAVWERFDSPKRIVRGAGYDAAGPLLLGISIPTSGTAGQALSFSASPFDVWSAIGSTDWSFGDGTAASGVNVSHTYAAAGTYQVSLSTADALGNPTSASGTVTIVPAAAATPAATTPASRPAISGAKLTNRRFRVAKRSTAISAKQPPSGTSIRFSLSAASKLQIAITATASGLRRGHSCLAPTPGLRRTHAKRCARTLRLGTLTRSSEPRGSDSVAFSGRIGHRALAAGSYKATLTATDAAGRSAPVTLGFVVVR